MKRVHVRDEPLHKFLEKIMSHNNVSNTNIKPFPLHHHVMFCEYAGGRFKVSEQGVYFLGKDKDGVDLPARWVCAPLYVLAKTRDAASGEWGRLLKWKDDDEVVHQWAMPIALLQGDASEVRRELAALGLAISPNRITRDLLASYLQVFPVENRVRCVDRLGWHQEVFVTANEIIGDQSESIVFQNTQALEPVAKSSGTVDDWKNSIGRLAAKNSRLVFAVSCAFAPSLAFLVNEDSGGFHLRGASSSGKSTALKVAASVWGDPAKYNRLWRATANGLEGLAAMHNDGLLILDELSQIDPKQAGEAAYLLANGQGKTRASKEGLARAANQWRLLFLSAGEESLTGLMARAGLKANVGQEIRLADIEADADEGMGIFECLHEYISPASLALALKEFTAKYHGAVGIEWLKAIVKDKEHLPKALSESMSKFVDKCTNPSMTGQAMRVARRFALVAMTGELATHYGFTGWTNGDATKAATVCFKTWLDAFGSNGNTRRKSDSFTSQGLFCSLWCQPL